MVCDMLEGLMNKANVRSEAQRTNVRCTIPAFVCLTAMLLVSACCTALLVSSCGQSQVDKSQVDKWKECIEMTSERVGEETPDERWDRIYEIKERHRDLFRAFPNYTGYGHGWWGDGRGNDILVDGERVYGITVNVAEPVDQDALPAHQRIPSCIEGVPVRVFVSGEPEFA